MRCKRINKLITLYVSKDTSEKESGAVEGHIRYCSSCTRALEHYRELTQAITTLEFKQCPEEDLNRIWERISTTLDEKERVKQSRKNLRFTLPHLLRNYNLTAIRRLVSHPLVAGLIVLVIVQSFFLTKTLKDKPRRLTQSEMTHFKGGSIPPTSILKTSPWNTLSTNLNNENRLKI